MSPSHLKTIADAVCSSPWMPPISKILMAWGCLLSALISRDNKGKPLSDFVPVACNLAFWQSLTETLGKRAASGVHQSVTTFVFVDAGVADRAEAAGVEGAAVAEAGKNEAHAAINNAACAFMFTSEENRLQQDAMTLLFNGLHCISTSTPYFVYFRPAAARRMAALSVRSHVNSGSSRPK